VYDIDGGAGRRLSLEGFDEDPVWTADGEWILFTSDRAGSADIYRKRADGTTDVAEEVIVGELDVFGASVSPDGTEVFYTLDTGDQDDVFKAFVDGGGPEPILASAFAEREARLSPDGTLLAYVTDRTGSPEVYVLDVATGRPVPVSIGGGYDPVWATDGSELYFMQQGGRIMAAALDETATDLGFTTPQALFELPPNVLATFDPAGDGRFLAVERIINPSGDPDDEQPAGGPQIHVVLNWIEELKERVPTGR
jgi:Tol biopolymer transport system component